jgi:hypothetical protein
LTDPLTPDTTPEPAQEPVEETAPAVAPELAAPAAPEPAPVLEAEPLVAEPLVAAAPVAQVPVAEPAPLAVSTASAASASAASAAAPAGGSAEVLGLPLKLLNELLAKIGATPLHSLADLVPALRILALAVVAGIALKLTSATIGAIDDLPLVGGLLELVGLVSLLNFLARNAFKQQKRAELLARIQKLKTDLLG